MNDHPVVGQKLRFVALSRHTVVLILLFSGFFTYLWLRDYPKPMGDDLYYAGAALNMADGGDFSNPLIERQEYPSHYFFVYPPLHPYALLGWLKTFGISTLSVTGFQVALCLIAAFSTVAIFRKYKAPRLLDWLIPLALCTSLLPTGLRAEALSVGLTMAGLALTECVGGSLLNFVGFLLMLLGASAAPRLALFSGSLLVAAMFNRWKESEKPTVIIISAVGAFLCSIAIFLVQIQFKLHEFWHTFHVHAQLVPTRKFDGLVRFINEHRYVNGSNVPLIWTWIVLLFFDWPNARSAFSRLGIAAVCGFVLELIVGGLGAGTLWYVLFSLLILSSDVLIKERVPRLKFALLLTFFFLLSNAEFAVLEIQRWKGRVTDNRGDQVEAALKMRSTPEHPILIDCSTARYVYGYQIPKGFYDIEFSSPFPDSHIIYKYRPEDIYVIGPLNVDLLNTTTRLVHPIELHNVFGLANRRLVLEPWKVFIISAEQCQPKGNLP